LSYGLLAQELVDARDLVLVERLVVAGACIGTSDG
jgi:hypothetical protein